MVNYQNGKIYKLICSETERVYIGSTTNELKKRLYGHKRKENKCVTKNFINPKIELVENYSCNSKRELEVKEQYYIELYSSCNSNKSFLSKEKRKEEQKNWRDNNPNYQKEWFDKNKVKMKKWRDKWREENIDRKRQTDIKSKLKQNILINCECGKEVKKYEMKRHIKSKYHITRM